MPKKRKYPYVVAQWTDREDNEGTEWRVVANDPMNGQTRMFPSTYLSLERNEGPDALGNPMWSGEGFEDAGGGKFASFFEKLMGILP